MSGHESASRRIPPRFNWKDWEIWERFERALFAEEEESSWGELSQEERLERIAKREKAEAEEARLGGEGYWIIPGLVASALILWVTAKILIWIFS